MNEGEGDFLLVGDTLLAGSGFRSDPRSQREAQEFFGRQVLGLTLVDPRFYHLDTALSVLDRDEVMYYPAAFSPESREVLADRFPDAVLAEEADAVAFGLNAVSDGLHVVLPEQARGWPPSSPSAGSSRSASTCPSCSRPAAAPSAARWNCVRRRPPTDLAGRNRRSALAALSASRVRFQWRGALDTASARIRPAKCTEPPRGRPVDRTPPRSHFGGAVNA